MCVAMYTNKHIVAVVFARVRYGRRRGEGEVLFGDLHSLDVAAWVQCPETILTGTIEYPLPLSLSAQPEPLPILSNCCSINISGRNMLGDERKNIRQSLKI